jgi:hypothetical protein
VRFCKYKILPKISQNFYKILYPFYFPPSLGWAAAMMTAEVGGVMYNGTLPNAS